MRRDRAMLLGFVLASAALACKESRPKPELFGVFRGCTEIKADRTCLYTSGSTLTVWFDASASSKVEVQIDGDEVTTKLIPAEDGARLELPLEDHAERVRVDMKGGRFELPLKWVETATPAEAGPREAYRLHQAGLRALRRGDAEKARALLVDAEGRARASGADHRLREIAYTLTYLDISTYGEFRAAEQRRHQLPRPQTYDGRAIVFMAWLKGLVAWRLGDRRAAHRELDLSVLWGSRLRSPARRDAMSLQGLLLLESGRSIDAARLFDKLRGAATRGACQWATDTLNAGWARLTSRSPAALAEAEALFRDAISENEARCPDGITRNHLLINLALVHLEGDRPAEARRRLLSVDGRLNPTQRFWIRLIEARIALLEGRSSDAARLFDDLAQHAMRSRLHQLEWEARLRAGKAYFLAGRQATGIQRLRMAEQVLDRSAFLMPAHEGRFSWLSEQEESSKELVTQLVGTGALDSAFAAARHARRRAFHTLAAVTEVDRLQALPGSTWSERVAGFEEARQALSDHRSGAAWSAAANEVGRMNAREATLAANVDRAMDAVLELLPPRPEYRATHVDEGSVVLLPARSSDGSLLFLATDSAVAVHPVIGSLAETVRSHVPTKVGRIVLLSRNPKEATELAKAISFKVPVSFGLDLGPAGPSFGSARVIVADPRGDLADARTEAEAIARLWTEPSVDLLQGRHATRSRVMQAVVDSELFHYAGHGRTAGTDGWDSALLLADNELTVGDVLFLASVPRTVVLSGCETAKTGQSSGAGIGLGQAFLVAGSEAVIATHRTVASDDARAYAVALHEALAREGADIYEAHRAAIQSVGDAADAFVLLVR